MKYGPESMLQKQQEILMMLQERFSKFMNVNTEASDISLLKPSADSLVLQVNEFHNDPEVHGTFANKCESVKMFSKTISLISQMMKKLDCCFGGQERLKLKSSTVSSTQA